MTSIRGKQVFPAAAMGNLPAIAAPQSLEQYLARINQGLATAEYLVGASAPYTTIQAAINAAVADGASPTNPKVVSVMPGFYSESLTLTGGGITLVALAQNFATASVFLQGSVSVVDPGSAPGEFPSYAFQGFYIEGAIAISGTPSAIPCNLLLDNTTVFPTAPGNVITNAVNNFALVVFNSSRIVAPSAADFAVFSPVGAELTTLFSYASANRMSIGNGLVNADYSNLGTLICGSSSYAILNHSFISGDSEAPLQLNATGGQLSRLYHVLFERTGTAGPAVAATAPYRHARCAAVGNLTDPAFPSAGSFEGFDWEGYAGTVRNRSMVASTTVADGNLACATALSVRPAQGSFPKVFVNGVEMLLASTPGEKTTSACYFSGDGGVTARGFGQTGNIAAGDLLYWNGSIAGFQLDPADRVRFDYPVDPYQINP